MGYSHPTQVIKLAVLSLLQEREAPRLQQGLPVTSGLPHRLCPMGGGSRAVFSRSLHTQSDNIFVTSVVWPKQLEQKRSDCRLRDNAA